MSRVADRLAAVFAADGVLAKRLPGFRPRRQQLEMAEAVAQTIETNGILVAEAGTGTGKTFAYLAPAILTGAKTIISTGTKTLQDQLYKRDLPLLREALKAPLTAALLKGRANYVCRYRLERSLAAARLRSREEIAHLQAIARFAKITRTGDKAECGNAPEDSPAWRLATSTRENCLGQNCPHYKECFVLAARREALRAELVVVNHHLFFADLMLKDDGLGELLPAANAVIFDEAHQLPAIASVFFGENLSSGQFLDLAHDVRLEAAVAAKDRPSLAEAAVALDKAARELRLAFRQEGRLNRRQWRDHPSAIHAMQRLAARLEQLLSELESQAERSEGLVNCQRRAAELARLLAHWEEEESEDRDGNASEDDVRWLEVNGATVAFYRTPMTVAPLFRKQLSSHPHAWIFTSATLAVGEDFSHFQAALGLDGALTARWESPFDYSSHALLCCPTDLPEPNHPDHPLAVVEAAWPVIQAAGGRAFVLCTSLAAMRRIHALLAEKIAEAKAALTLLLQGEGSKSDLLDRFRRLGNAVLVASQSFWEGIDVRGEALSLVVIDKLPFVPPDDPLLAARIEKLKREGRNAFFEEQLPHAVINLKQGAGRLIRSEVDRGVLLVCDPRLVTKPYGKKIWQALPPMRRTRDLAEAVAFFSATATACQAG